MAHRLCSLLYLEAIVPETDNKPETTVFCFLDFLGNYELSMLSKITIVGVFFKGRGESSNLLIFMNFSREPQISITKVRGFPRGNGCIYRV